MMYGPDPTPFSDWWKTRHRPRQHPRIADDQYRLSSKSVVQGLLGMLPGVGEAMDAWDVGAGLLQKDPKRVGAGLLGAALPFVSGRTLRGYMDDITARRHGVPPDLQEGSNLMAAERAWRDALATEGAEVTLRSGATGRVVRPIAGDVHSGRVGIEVDLSDFDPTAKRGLRGVRFFDPLDVTPLGWEGR